MGSLPPSSSWTPQDDILLINAVMVTINFYFLKTCFDFLIIQRMYGF